MFDAALHLFCIYIIYIYIFYMYIYTNTRLKDANDRAVMLTSRAKSYIGIGDSIGIKLEKMTSM